MTIDNGKNFLKYHNKCLVCGQRNKHSWKLKFKTDDRGITSTQFQSCSDFQGYNDFLHGGVITTLLDATMTHCLFDHGIIAMTGNLRVRFLHPISCNSLLCIQARVMKRKKNLYLLYSTVMLKGKIMARGEARFIEVKPNT